MTQLRSVTCHMGSHSVTCYPTQVNTPHLNPSHAGQYSIYLPRRDMEGWVDLVDLIAPRPEVEPATFWSRVRCRCTTRYIQECPCEQKPVKNLGEKGAWAYYTQLFDSELVSMCLVALLLWVWCYVSTSDVDRKVNRRPLMHKFEESLKCWLSWLRSRRFASVDMS